MPYVMATPWDAYVYQLQSAYGWFYDQVKNLDDGVFLPNGMERDLFKSGLSMSEATNIARLLTAANDVEAFVRMQNKSTTQGRLLTVLQHKGRVLREVIVVTMHLFPRDDFPSISDCSGKLTDFKRIPGDDRRGTHPGAQMDAWDVIGKISTILDSRLVTKV